ncbi:bile acid:sodium symporter family protein [Endozoicomonas ascidiicola]|uniref:bile acid:sodium symporter family protein n=1 Tax=Endozoicomonas ascidiicola TaxID=1698521 RepID=UPI0008331E86|nr:bile acid:sodium symporter family protein [Endozoicomonas ascidiicola]
MLTDVQIHFEPQSLLLLNAILALMMFGVSLNLKPDDFWKILKTPIAPTIGLVAQFLVLPFLTSMVVWIFNIDPELGLGMILVASCPGGTFSNIMTHIARGNVAVSVSMTAVSSLFAIVMTPFNFFLYGQLNPVTSPLIQEIALQPLEIFLLVTMVLAVPLLMGMMVGQVFPKFVKRSDTPFRFLSLLVFLAFIIIAVSNNVDVFLEHMGSFAILVVAHNAMALSIGATAAYLGKLNSADRRAVTLEVGIQNSGLGLGILFTFFPQYGGMMVITAFWGVLHLVSGLGLALFWNTRTMSSKEASYVSN